MAGTKKILLVEDDNNLREIYGARLQAEGYDIVAAPDGENALAMAVKEKPDLIISDVMMPKISGFDMLDILRNAPETKNTKVIMMTALSQAEDKARADKLGADLYLVKSQVTLEDVAKAVHKILDDDQAEQEQVPAAAAEESQADSNPEPQSETPAASPPPEPVSAPSVATVTEPPKEEQSQPEPLPEPAKNEATQETPVVEQPAQDTPPIVAPPNPDPVQQDPPSTTSTQIDVKAVEEKPPAVVEQTQTENTPPQSQDIATPTAPEELAVEPNLAQALEEEEKAVQKKIENFENAVPDLAQPPEAKASVETQQPTQGNEKTAPEAPKPADEKVTKPSEEPTVQDQATTNNPTQQSQPTEAQSKAEDPLDDKPKKRVIEPLNDPTKGPDMDKLLAKEEENQAAPVSETNEIITPKAGEGSDQPAQPPQASKAQSDDLGKISL